MCEIKKNCENSRTIGMNREKSEVFFLISKQKSGKIKRNIEKNREIKKKKKQSGKIKNNRLFLFINFNSFSRKIPPLVF